MYPHNWRGDFMLAVCLALIDDDDDKKAFEKLYNKYKNKVYAISFDILKNVQLAEESTADTFLSLARSFQKINKLEYHKLDCYIVITSRNMAFNMLKKEKVNISDVQYNDDLILDNNNLSEYDYIFLKDCIKQLNYTDREIFYLKFSCGLEYSDISKALGISVSAARKRLQYAKDKLKKILEQEDL